MKHGVRLARALAATVLAPTGAQAQITVESCDEQVSPTGAGLAECGADLTSHVLGRSLVRVVRLEPGRRYRIRMSQSTRLNRDFSKEPPRCPRQPCPELRLTTNLSFQLEICSFDRCRDGAGN